MKTRTNHGGVIDLPELNPGLKIGDPVSFVRQKHVGQSIELRRMDGIVINFPTPNGNMVRVKYHGGNTVWLHRSKITRR